MKCDECDLPALAGLHLCHVHMARLAARLRQRAGATCPRCGETVPTGHFLCTLCTQQDQMELGESYALMERLTRPRTLARFEDVLASVDVTSLEALQHMAAPDLEDLLGDQLALKEQLQELRFLRVGTQEYGDQRYEIALTLYRFPPGVRDLLRAAIERQEQ